MLGVSTYTFAYAEGGAYLTNNSAACANCHVMREQYEGWQRASHQAVATCNDCHAPSALLPKLAVKGINGFNHSWAFTTGRFHEPIQITEMNRRVTESACRGCHQAVVEVIDAHPNASRGSVDEPLACIRCHDSVGHLH